MIQRSPSTVKVADVINLQLIYTTESTQVVQVCHIVPDAQFIKKLILYCVVDDPNYSFSLNNNYKVYLNCIVLLCCYLDLDDENWCANRPEDFPSGLITFVPPTDITRQTQFTESALNLSSFPLTVLLALALSVMMIRQLLRI